METNKNKRKPYPSDVSDAEWAFVAPYLSLMKEDAPQRDHALREVFNGLRWMVRGGTTWRMIPHDLREILRLAEGKKKKPSAAIIDSQTIQSTPESGGRAGYDGHKKKKGSKIHMAVDTLGHLLALQVTPANEQERAQVKRLCQEIQEVTGESVEIAFVDQGYTGDQAKEDAKEHGIELQVVKLPQAKRGFVLLPKRWVVERSFAWKSRFRRLVRDYERLPEVLSGLHFLAFAILMLRRFAEVIFQSA
ncbi:MAG: IS5 family transposase [wastewater metagenome]|nr:IS5 family transposase [Candidatus Loosdrechtia aerotolerans]